MRFRTVPALFAAFLFVWTSSSAQVHREDLFLTMDDGVALDATFIKPVSSQPDSGFPAVVLVHGLGGKKEHMLDVALALADRGYASLSYSVRGQGNSGGLRTFSGARERQDLRYLIRWLGARPDVDSSRIAVVGGSQGGIHAWWAAAYDLGVRTVVAIAGYLGDLSSNGCVETATLGVLSSSRVRYGPLWQKVYDWVLDDEYDSLQVALEGADSLVAGVKLPVMVSLAYRDWLFSVNQGIRQFELLAGPKFLHLGTGYHGAEEVDAVTVTTVQLVFQWLDVWLKDSTGGSSQIPGVAYHVVESWELRTADGWPPREVQWISFYLNPGGTLDLHAPRFDYRAVVSQELRDPAYTSRDAVGDRFGAATVAKFQQQTLEFVSAPFNSDVEWAGSPRCRFRVRWSGAKAQLHVQFYDVDPQNKWHFLQRGNFALRGGSRDTVLAFDAQAYAHVFRKGHRIGVRLCAVDYVDEEGMCYVLPFFDSFSDTLLGTPELPLEITMPLLNWEATAVLAGGGSSGIPAGYRLVGPYPNPFNSRAALILKLPEITPVHAAIYDSRGREVQVLVRGQLDAGQHRLIWNGRDAAGRPQPSGIYLAVVRAGKLVLTRKLCLVR